MDETRKKKNFFASSDVGWMLNVPGCIKLGSNLHLHLREKEVIVDFKTRKWFLLDLQGKGKKTFKSKDANDVFKLKCYLQIFFKYLEITFYG